LPSLYSSSAERGGKKKGRKDIISCQKGTLKGEKEKKGFLSLDMHNRKRKRKKRKGKRARYVALFYGGGYLDKKGEGRRRMLYIMHLFLKYRRIMITIVGGGEKGSKRAIGLNRFGEEGGPHWKRLKGKKRERGLRSPSHYQYLVSLQYNLKKRRKRKVFFSCDSGKRGGRR